MALIRAHPGSPRGVYETARLSAKTLALALQVPATLIGDILRTEKPQAVSADTAIRLARYFGTTPEFWLNLRLAYYLSLALAEHGPAVERDVHPREELAA